MKLLIRSKALITLAPLLITFAVSAITFAQGGDIDERRDRVALNRPVIKNVPVPIYKDRIVIKKVPVQPQTASIIIVTEPGAAYLIERLDGPRQRKGFNIGDRLKGDVRSAEIPGLHPGRYRVAAELDGFKGKETVVTVAAGRNERVELNLEPIKHTVTVVTNVPRADVKYAPVEESADASTAVKYRQVQKGSFATVEKNQAVLSGLLPGKYALDVSTREVGYEPFFGIITVPGDTDKVDAKLNFVRSTDNFTDELIKKESWKFSNPNWQVLSGKLLTRGRGVAIPQNERLRHYTDFGLISDANMLNGVAASFVARYRDDKNYYLIQITGPNNSNEPYFISFTKFTDGVRQRIQSIPIPRVLEPGKYFQVKLKMEDNKIHASIIPAESGKNFNLGTLTDPQKSLSMGAVGIAAEDNEQSEFGSFIVCASEKQCSDQ